MYTQIFESLIMLKCCFAGSCLVFRTALGYLFSGETLSGSVTETSLLEEGIQKSKDLGGNTRQYDVAENLH